MHLRLIHSDSEVKYARRLNLKDVRSSRNTRGAPLNQHKTTNWTIIYLFNHLFIALVDRQKEKIEQKWTFNSYRG